ncbi:MAG: hypothetical protein JKX74_05610 [Flavobacteriales bacterium]|nr:hypothetical protein [Flavobacteriales bacterium]
MRYVLFILLTITSVSSCSEFEIVGAIIQPWSGGIAGSPGGSNYTLEMVALKNSSELQIDQLWVGEQFFEVKARKKLLAWSSNGFIENDTIYIGAVKVNDVKNGNLQNSIARPSGQQGLWVVGYLINGKRKYVGTDDIKVLKSIANP